MELLVLHGLGLVGVVIGAAGSELLRARKPELVKQIEESAKRFAGRSGSLESRDKESDTVQQD